MGLGFGGHCCTTHRLRILHWSSSSPPLTETLALKNSRICKAKTGDNYLFPHVHCHHNGLQVGGCEDSNSTDSRSAVGSGATSLNVSDGSPAHHPTRASRHAASPRNLAHGRHTPHAGLASASASSSPSTTTSAAISPPSRPHPGPPRRPVRCPTATSDSSIPETASSTRLLPPHSAGRCALSP